MSTYLVTGGAGFIGSHLTKALLDAGEEVRVLDTLAPPAHIDGQPRRLDSRAELVRGDVRSPNDLKRALDGVTTVIHLAAEGGYTAEIAGYIDTNSIGTARLLETIRKHRFPVRKMLVASSMAVYGEGTGRCPNHGRVRPAARRVHHLEAGRYQPTCTACDSELEPVATLETDAVQPERPYSITKYSQERLVLSIAPELGIDAAALRYFVTYGPGQPPSNPYTGVISIFSRRIHQRTAPIVYEDGEQTRDFIYVADLVEAHLLLLRQPSLDGRVYNVGTGSSISLHEVANLVAKAFDLDIAAEIPGRYRLGDVRHISGDITRLAALGFQPKVTMSEGIRRFVDDFLAIQKSDTDDRGPSFADAEAGLLETGLVRKSADHV